MNSRIENVVALGRALLAAVCVLAAAGCAGYSGADSPATGPAATQPPAQGQAPVQAQSPDLLRVGDKLTIVFSDIGVNGLPPHDQEIREDGKITPPFIGEIVAANKTRGQLEKELLAKYKPDYFKNVSITIRSVERLFYVGGEVRQPSRQVYTGEMTVLKAIKAAGGFTDFANKRRVKIIRASKKVEHVNCLKALDDPKQDVPIYPGDQIEVKRRLF